MIWLLSLYHLYSTLTSIECFRTTSVGIGETSCVQIWWGELARMMAYANLKQTKCGDPGDSRIQVQHKPCLSIEASKRSRDFCSTRPQFMDTEEVTWVHVMSKTPWISDYTFLHLKQPLYMIIHKGFEKVHEFYCFCIPQDLLHKIWEGTTRHARGQSADHCKMERSSLLWDLAHLGTLFSPRAIGGHWRPLGMVVASI